MSARVLSLPSSNLPILEFASLAINSIVINLTRKKATISIVSKAPKLAKKRKIFAKAPILTLWGQKDAKDSKSKSPKKKYCRNCESFTHSATKCWTFYP